MSNFNDDDSRERPSKPIMIPDVGRIDPRKIGSVYGVPSARSKEPDYIPYNARGRDFMGRLFFNTGLCWLGGFSAGGVYGFSEGWRKAANPNFKIRFNSVMNAVSRRGSTLGNALGIIGKSLLFVAMLRYSLGIHTNIPVFYYSSLFPIYLLCLQCSIILPWFGYQIN